MNFKIGMTIYILIWLSLLLLFVHSLSPPKPLGIPQIGCGQRKSVSQNNFLVFGLFEIAERDTQPLLAPARSNGL
jgi:hypothetical protein